MILGCKSPETRCAERLDALTGAMNAAVDPAELQTWASTILQGHEPGEELQVTMPKSLKTLEKYEAWVSVSRLDQPKEKIVEVWWRTEYGRKGIMIGSPTSQLMTSTEPCKREWKPGIVLFCQAE